MLAKYGAGTAETPRRRFARADPAMARLEDRQGNVPGQSDFPPSGANLNVPTDGDAQGYELTEDEVRISLEDFRAQYSDSLGGPEYANPCLSEPSTPPLPID